MRYFFLCFLIFSPFLSFEQKASIKVSKNPVLVGEPFDISLSVQIPSGNSFSIADKLDSLPFSMKNDKGQFERVLDKVEITSFNQKKVNTNLWEGSVKAVIWDSGTFVFPSIPFKLEGKQLVFDSAVIESRLVDKVEGKDIYEIRESFIDVKEAEKKAEEEKQKSNTIFYGLIIATVVLVLIIIFIMARRVRKKKQEKILRDLSLSERAILAIDELEKLQLWNKERHKEHFVELSFILRSYFSTFYNLNLLEKTTTETIILLNQKKLSRQLILQIEFILKHADMVKFAKSILEEQYILSLDNQGRESIRQSVKEYHVN